MEELFIKESLVEKYDSPLRFPRKREKSDDFWLQRGRNRRAGERAIHHNDVIIIGSRDRSLIILYIDQVAAACFWRGGDGDDAGSPPPGHARFALVYELCTINMYFYCQ